MKCTLNLLRCTNHPEAHHIIGVRGVSCVEKSRLRLKRLFSDELFLRHRMIPTEVMCHGEPRRLGGFIVRAWSFGAGRLYWEVGRCIKSAAFSGRFRGRDTRLTVHMSYHFGFGRGARGEI